MNSLIKWIWKLSEEKSPFLLFTFNGSKVIPINSHSNFDSENIKDFINNKIGKVNLFIIQSIAAQNVLKTRQRTIVQNSGF